MPKKPKRPRSKFKRKDLSQKRDLKFPKLRADLQPEVIEGWNYKAGGVIHTRKSKGFSSIRKAS